MFDIGFLTVKKDKHSKLHRPATVFHAFNSATARSHFLFLSGNQPSSTRSHEHPLREDKLSVVVRTQVSARSARDGAATTKVACATGGVAIIYLGCIRRLIPRTFCLRLQSCAVDLPLGELS